MRSVRARLGAGLTALGVLASGLVFGVVAPAGPAIAADAPLPTPSAVLRWTGDTSSATGAALANERCDVNGDGYADAVVGAWFWDKAPLSNIGAAYVLLGGPSPTGGSLATPSSVGAVRIDGPSIANAFVGFAVACVGDVNGDDLDDIAISYYVDQKVFVVLGARNFTSANLSAIGERGFVIAGGPASGNVGYSMSPVGDLDGDGLADFAVAEVVADTHGRTNNGRVWIIAGQDDVADIDLTAPTAGQVLFTIDGAYSEERLGVIANVGDVNGDGTDDVLLGSYTSTPWGSGVAVPGAAYVVWGGSSVDVDLLDLGTAGFKILGPNRQRDRLGISVSGVGDLDGDGKADLLIGADGVTNAATGPRNGGAAVVFGSDSTATVYTDPLATNGSSVYTCANAAVPPACDAPADVQPRGYWIDGAVASDSAGYAIAGLGDVDGDGVGDLAIGAYGYDPVNPANPPATMSGAGAVWVVYGKSSTTAQSLASLNADEGYRIDGLAAGDRFGRQVGVVGDMDGNGFVDFAAGGDFAARPGAQSGEVAVALMGPLNTSVAVIGTPSAPMATTAVTLTATVTVDVPGQTVGGGSVSFAVAGTPVTGCTAVAVDPLTGAAECETTIAEHGANDVTATYSGTATRAAAASTPAVVTVSDQTTTSLDGPATLSAGSPTTFTANVVPVHSAKPVGTGTVAFTVDGTALAGCAAVAVAAGVATCSSTIASSGDRVVTAAYSGTPVLGASTSSGHPVDVTPAAMSAFVPLGPCRVADTRAAGSVTSGITRVDVAGRCDVPSDATAVAVTLTVDHALTAGHLTAWPSGLVRPTASNLNFAAGETRANGAIVALGAGGAIDVHVYSPVEGVIVDVTGAFVPSGGASAGRFTPTTPVRAFDSRQAAALGDNGVANVPLPAGVPSDAVAVAATITVTETSGAGHVSAWPAGATQPNASVVNADRADQTRASGVIVPVSAAGITLFASKRTQVIVDVTGYFTGASSAVSTDGLFVPTVPQRLIDTRETTVIGGGTARDVAVPVGAAIAANVTIVDATRPGWLVAYAAGAPAPSTSTVNAASANQNAASFTIVSTGVAGVTLRAQHTTHAIVDVSGYFMPAAPAPPPDPPDPSTTTTTTPSGPTTTVPSGPALSEAYVNRNWTPTEHDTCPAALHASFSTIGPDGKLYPTWHPPQVIDPATGQLCTFGHEHGDDPAGSDIAGWVAQVLDPASAEPGIPFGFANEALDAWATAGSTTVTRHEDNVGNKVYWANDVKLITASPRAFVRFTDSTGNSVPVECDYLIKLHQGSHSADATTNNAHELFYAMRCNDGTEMAVTTISRIGDANEYHRSCEPAAVVHTSGSNLPDGDGGRRLLPDRTCIDRFVLVSPAVPSAHTDIWSLYEVWQTANAITTPDGSVLASFDPWFAVRNPSRYGWSAKNPDGSDGIGYTVDAAWETDSADGGVVNADPWLAICTLPVIAPRSPESPFDGAERDFYVRTSTVTNAGGPTIWYTDPYGANASTAPFPGSIRQYISATSNAWYPLLERRVFGMDADYGAGQGVHAPN